MVVNAGAAIPAIGASGAISGVMAAYLLLFPRSRVVVMIPIFFFPFFFDFLAVLYLGYWFALQLFSDVSTLAVAQPGGGIAFWAYIGGFLVGAALLGLFRKPRARRERLHRDEGHYQHAWMSPTDTRWETRGPS